MKYKKYLFIFILTIFIGCNEVFAQTYDKKINCYYANDNVKANLTINYNQKSINNYNSEGIFNPIKINAKFVRPHTKTLKIKNVGSDFKYKDGNTTITAYNITASNNKPLCPEYLIASKKNRAFVSNSLSDTQAITSYLNNQGIQTYYSKNVSEEEYYDLIIDGVGIGGNDYDIEENCNELFGDKNDAGVECEEGDIDCEERAPSLAYIINSVMQYVRIIVPIIIILLGTLDFAQAVIASKEDEMKKAQTKFIKRLIAGVAVFLVPVFINIIMGVTDTIWSAAGYNSCQEETIESLK